MGVGGSADVPLKSNGLLANVHIGLSGYLGCIFCDAGGNGGGAGN